MFFLSLNAGGDPISAAAAASLVSLSAEIPVSELTFAPYLDVDCACLVLYVRNRAAWICRKRTVLLQ
jgi:hypothetical protein